MHVIPSADLAPRTEVVFACPSNHRFEKVFSAEVTAPTVWECPRCGKLASPNQESVTTMAANSRKTHWDMIVERRDSEELSRLLSERVDQLRAD